MDKVVDLCHASRPAQAGKPVRLPGEKGFALAAQQREQGMCLHAGIMEALRPWSEKLKVQAPAPL